MSGPPDREAELARLPWRGRPEDRLSDEDRERIELLERRDAAYAALRDLEQDHRTGKVEVTGDQRKITLTHVPR